MQVLKSGILALPFFLFTIGCSGSTNWEPIAESVCEKYAERVTILTSVQTREDAKAKVALIESWQSEYDRLNDKLLNTILNLRNSGGDLNIGKFDQLKKRWAETDEKVKEQLQRLGKMNGVGPDYDPDLGKIMGPTFSNPFR